MNKDKLIKLGYKVSEVELDDPHWNSSLNEVRVICPDGFKFLICSKLIYLTDSQFVKRETAARAYEIVQRNKDSILEEVEKALIKNIKAKKVTIHLK